MVGEAKVNVTAGDLQEQLHGLTDGILFIAPTGSYEGGAIAYHDMSFAQYACLLQQSAINLADGGLSCTRSSEEDGMKGHLMLFPLREIMMHALIITAIRLRIVRLSSSLNLSIKMDDIVTCYITCL